jgi:hypothetical protein
MQIFKSTVATLGAVFLVVLLVAAGLWQMAWGSFTPINFRGKVLDTDGRPVSGAEVHASFAVFPYSPGRKAETITDENGAFQFWGMGASITVKVAKDGYYTLPESGGNFETWPPGSTQTWPVGAGDYPHSSSTNPIIFKLRKMGICEPLLKHNLGGKIDKNGEPISFDLSSGRTFKIANPDVTLQSWVGDEGSPGTYKRFDWRFLITVPGGGIQTSTGGDFNFIAPEAGYKASDEISEVASDPKWEMSFQRDYFLRLRNGEYVRMHLEYGAGGYNTYFMTFYLNPTSGHRNLESATK